MKSYKLLLPILLFPFAAAFAQRDSVTVYYNKNWKILVDSSEDVFYVRKATRKDNFWFVNDYYNTTNRTLQMSGAYKYALDSVKVGAFKYYFDNGTLSEEGKYIDGKREGLWKEWHKNGNVSYVGHYKEGYLVGKYESWWDNGNKYAEEQYLEDIDKIRSYEQKDSTGKTITRLGVLIGTCNYYFKNGVMSSREKWKNDTLVAMDVWNENGVSESPTRDKHGRLTAEVMPEFKEAIGTFVAKNIKYPKKSRARNQQGRVSVKFVVEKDGSIEEAKVEETSGFPLLDEEAVRVVYMMSGNWTPGKQHNQPIRVYYTLPVTYKLDK